MTIREVLKRSGWQLECPVSKVIRFANVDVDFGTDGEPDEAQFTIKHPFTKAAEDELTTLFTAFCKENNYSTNTVISVTVVSTAETLKELYAKER